MAKLKTLIHQQLIWRIYFMAVFYFRPNVDEGIRNINELGLSEEQVKLCTDENLAIEEVNLIAKCLADGIPYERLKKYIKHKFSINHCYYVDDEDDTNYYSIIEYIVEGLKLGFSDEQISLYATGSFNHWRMGIIIKAIEEGFTPTQIATIIKYASYNYNSDKMEELYNKVKNG